MAEVIFNLNGVSTKIKCQKEDLMKDIVKKFSIASSTDVNEMLLLYHGSKIDQNITFMEQAKDEDKAKNSINIMCHQIGGSRKESKKEVKVEKYTKRKIPNIPRRKSLRNSVALKKRSDIALENNNDSLLRKSVQTNLRRSGKKIEINDIPNAEISLEKNNNNNNNTTNNISNNLNFDKMFNYNEFFRPYSCYIDLNNNNDARPSNLTQYNTAEINFVPRNTTGENYNYKNISIENKMENEINEFQTKFENFNNKIKEIINTLNKISENINLFYEITQDKMENSELVEKDDEIINNIKVIIDDYQKFINDIEQSIENNKMTNISENFNKIINSYKESNKDIIKYKINEGDKLVKIFGSTFVLNNWDNCRVICEDQEYRLTEFFELKNYTKNSKILEIKLKVFRELKDISFMFSDCSSLISISRFITWNTENVTNMRGMFAACTSLKNLPDLSLLKTDNVKNMRGLFAGCEILESIPDISGWNTENVTDMQYMFHNCLKLKTLPDISKWNTSNVIDMRFMFYNCSSLIVLPDISKWNTKKVTSIQGIFEGCSALFSLPNISKWDLQKNIDMKNMFNKCKKTLRIPLKFKKYVTFNKLPKKGK